MNYSFLIILLITFLSVSCKMNYISGNGDIVSEQREVDFFDKIDVSGNFDVDVLIAEKIKIDIEAEENLLKHIQTKVRDNTLYISSRRNLRPTEEMSIIIQVPLIKKISCSGLNNIKAYDLNNDGLIINLSGASNIKASGITKYLDIDVSGAANIDAKDLLAGFVKIDASGASNAEIFASKLVNIDVSGAGNVTLFGPADDVKFNVSGAGSFKRK